MAGHSKWANIKHRKGAQDARRGKLFTKLIRLITTAARQSGGDEATNPLLRLAVTKALTANMTRDTIDRAIKRGVGAEDQSMLEENNYEGYGHSGVAVLVECLTDNRNRTVGDVRHAFSKCGGNLGTPGSVSYLFTKQGVISFAPGAEEEKIFEIALDAGALDVVVYDDQAIDVMTAPEQFETVNNALQAKGLTADLAEVNMVPALQVAVDSETQEKIQKLIDMLEDLDDVQNVYTNME
jgi:transcriptional/translational regulatory protein YebC/TACO1